MTVKYSNELGLDLSVAVWLAHDNYDAVKEPWTISCTGLLKSCRQIILAQRVPEKDAIVDVSAMLASRIGTAIHDSIERVWTTKSALQQSLLSMGYKQRVIDRIRVNPTPEEAQEPDIIPVYLEQRVEKKVGKWTVTGQFDIVLDGMLQDFKSTGVFTYTNRTKDADYIMQGSLYRWLSPDLITNPHMKIQYLFTDWSANQARSGNGKYPPSRVLGVHFPLEDTGIVHNWVIRKLSKLEQMWDLPESELPPCTPKDLWQKDPVFKYYKNPAKRARSTANFDNEADALTRLSADGHVGIVVEVPGEVVACKYCSAFAVCTQKDDLIKSGALKL